jgi:uncharacterized membrane protein YczE
VVVLLCGLWLFGTGEALLVASHLGNTPWTVLAQGVSRHSPLSIGASTFAISLVVLLLWVPLRERPGLGTVLNAVVIALAIDVMLDWLPQPGANAPRLAEVAGGIAAIGIGSALYLTTQLGPGPRDGWMTGIARRAHWPIASVRLGIEISVLVMGFLLGGRAGVGTVLFALTIGYAVAIAINALSLAVTRETSRARNSTPPPELGEAGDATCGGALASRTSAASEPSVATEHVASPDRDEIR